MCGHCQVYLLFFMSSPSNRPFRLDKDIVIMLILMLFPATTSGPIPPEKPEEDVERVPLHSGAFSF